MTDSHHDKHKAKTVKLAAHHISTLDINIPILPRAFLTFAEAKVGSAPPFVFCNSFPNNEILTTGRTRRRKRNIQI